MAITEETADLLRPADHDLTAYRRGSTHRVCDECAEPVERSRKSTFYGLPNLCRQCEINH